MSVIVRSSPISIGLTRNRVYLIVATILYVGLLQWSYRERIAPRFGYMGYTYQDVPLAAEYLSWLFAVLPATWMRIELTRPSQIVYWALYAIVLIPGLIVPQMTLQMDSADLAFLSCTLFAAFAFIELLYHVPQFRAPDFRLSEGVYFWLLGLTAAAMMANVVRVLGVRTHIPRFADVYVVRSAYKTAVAEAGGFVAYCLSWLATGLNPLVLALGLTRANVAMIATAIIGQLYLFGTTGLKSIIFSLALVPAIMFAIRSGQRVFGLLTLCAFNALVVASVLADSLTSGTLYVSLFVRRLLITPGLLTGYYYQFFSANPKAHLGYTIFGRVTADHPYDRPPSEVIGSAFFGSTTNANANIWADGFANFGLGGILAFSLLLTIVLWIYDGAARGVDLRVSGVLAGLTAVAIVNTALFTTILTHGTAIAILFLLLMPRRQPV